MASHLRVPLASTQGALPIREALVVTFLVDTQLRLVHFTADFLDPDGERVVRPLLRAGLLVLTGMHTELLVGLVCVHVTIMQA